MTVDTAPPPEHVVPAPLPPPSWRSWRAWVAPVGGLAAFVLWLLSLDSVRADVVSGWGLLPGLPVLWYVAFGLAVLAYVAVLLSRLPVTHGLVVPLFALVAVLFGTTSAVYDVPRYPWTYKHVGVTEYVLENWSVDRSVDIYHNFPGFFFLTAGISRVTGVEPLTLAQWIQPALALLTAAAVYWAVGGLTWSRRIRYGAVLVYTLGDWIGQNYFAPQGLAFPVALFVLGGLLRSVPEGREGLRWPALRNHLPLGDDPDLPRGTPFWGSRRGALVLALAFAYVVVSHPLTPLILLGQTALVCLLLRPPRPWLPLVFLLIEAAWLLQAWPFLSSTYDLFEFGLRNIEPPQVSIVDPLPGYQLSLWAAPLLMAVVALLTALSVLLGLRRRARLARLVVPLALVAVPVAMVLGQPYGNEGVFRAYLFALPWVGYVVASAVLDERRSRMPGRRGAITLVPLATIAVLTLPANFAGEMSYRVAASDVAAARWFDANAPEGAVLLPFTSSYPWRVGAGYTEHLPAPTEAVLGLTELPGFADAAGDQADLVDFTADACDSSPGNGPVFVATGPAADDNVRLFGTMRLYTYRAYERAMAVEPRFTEVFRDGSSVLFRCRG